MRMHARYMWDVSAQIPAQNLQQELTSIVEGIGGRVMIAAGEDGGNHTVTVDLAVTTATAASIAHFGAILVAYAFGREHQQPAKGS